MASTPRLSYTIEEEACLIAWLDYCAETGKDYEQTIIPEFQALVGSRREVTYDKIRLKVRDLLKSWGMKNKFSVKDIRNNGLKHITENGGQIPEETSREMQRLRALWDKGKFFSNAATPDHHKGEMSDNQSEAGNSRVPSLRLKLNRPVIDDTTTEPEPDEEDGAKEATPPATTSQRSQSVTKRSYVDPDEDEAHRSKRFREASPSSVVNAKDQCNETVDASLNELKVEDKYSQKVMATLTQNIENMRRLNLEAVIKEMLRYLLMQSEQLEEKSATIDHLLGGEYMQGLTQQFPPAPTSSDVKAAWEDFYLCILDTVGPGHVTPDPDPGPYALLWHNCLEQIASGQMAETELAEHMRVFEKHSISPHSQQALLSALFCRWVFQSPEPIFNAHHPPSTLEYLNVIWMISGMEQVARTDKVIAQALFDRADEQACTIQPRKQELVKNLSEVTKSICRTHDTPFTMAPEDMAKESLKLKLLLMISPKDYRIRYCQPGTRYDPAWMRARDDKNQQVADNKAAAKEITLCLFPALLAQDAQPFADDARIEDVLAKNKKFFAASDEPKSFDPKQCVAKAIVLVL